MMVNGDVKQSGFYHKTEVMGLGVKNYWSFEERFLSFLDVGWKGQDNNKVFTDEFSGAGTIGRPANSTCGFWEGDRNRQYRINKTNPACVISPDYYKSFSNKCNEWCTGIVTNYIIALPQSTSTYSGKSCLVQSLCMIYIDPFKFKSSYVMVSIDRRLNRYGQVRQKGLLCCTLHES